MTRFSFYVEATLN